MVLSVCLSVCLSVSHTFFTMFPSSYHPKIFRRDYQWRKWCPCKRSRSEVKGRGNRGRFRTVTPVWIHIWWWNDAQSLMLLRRGSLLFFKVNHQISRSHCNLSSTSSMDLKWCTKLDLFLATTGVVWIIPSFWIWDYVLQVEHISCASWIVANISESSLLLSQ